jgi:hypothetical protein
MAYGPAAAAAWEQQFPGSFEEQGAAKLVAPATNDDYTSKDTGFVFTAKVGTEQVNSPATGPNAILAISHNPHPRPEN